MNQKGAITTDPTDIKRIKKKYNEQVYVNKLDSVDEIPNFLKDTSYESSLKKKQVSFNSPIPTKEIEMLEAFHQRKLQA